MAAESEAARRLAETVEQMFQALEANVYESEDRATIRQFLLAYGDSRERAGLEKAAAAVCIMCEEPSKWSASRKIEHPMQPLTFDKHRVIRFKANKIVQFLLDAGPFDMNRLAIMEFSREDREQFAQLIGYSVSGFSELSYVRDKTYAKADALRAALLGEPEREKEEGS